MTIFCVNYNLPTPMNHFIYVSIDSCYSIKNIPFVGRSFVLSVIDCLNAMSLATHVSSKFKDLNYDKFRIENVHCILTTSISDVLFNYPVLSIPIVNLINKEWIRSMMAMRGARLKQLASRMTSTLLFKKTLPQTFKRFSKYFGILC